MIRNYIAALHVFDVIRLFNIVQLKVGEYMRSRYEDHSFGFTMLLLLFIALKLCHVIAWSWVWVMAPLWIPMLLVAILTVVSAFLVR